MMTLTVDDRLDALEAAVARIETGQAQAAAAVLAEVRAEGEKQRKAITDAGHEAAVQIGKVNAAVITVSTGLLTLQQQVTKWAAAGSLAGAVVLFIAVRALGF